MTRHWLALFFPLAAIGACTEPDVIGFDTTPDSRGFAPIDGGQGDAAASEGELVSYCPTNKCPAGWTTCPNSRFPCDVNLWTDVNNCGACGRRCPSAGAGATFACVEGVCAMQCSAFPTRLDCDGLADNGCEGEPLNDNHCGSCDKKCTDPAKRCADQTGRGQGEVDCGCPAGKLDCFRSCVDSNTDDYNCGGCFNWCDPTGGGLPAYSNSYYGCVNGSCDGLKCNARFADCDKVRENGCETSLVTNDNCGACGTACPDGQACRLDPDGKPTCMCPPGLTYCESGCDGDVCTGSCVDLKSNVGNCGACGAVCGGASAPNARRTCVYGACVPHCNVGRADCNNSMTDGCEVNTDSDPRNCGACGHVCDAVAGQACVAGKCAVEPCDTDAGTGEVAR